MFSGGCERKDIASINSVGNLGGFFGPTMVGWAKDYTGSFASGLYALAGFALLSAIVSAVLADSASGGRAGCRRAGGIGRSA